MGMYAHSISPAHLDGYNYNSASPLISMNNTDAFQYIDIETNALAMVYKKMCAT